MIRNIVKTTIRYFLKNGFFSVVNVLGLAMGLATSILIFLFVQDELSYDKHFKEAEHIYRIEPRYIGHGEDAHWAATQGDLAPRIKSMYPEVTDATKLHFFYNDVVGIYKENSFNESNVLVADTNFLTFFGIKVIAGNENAALRGSKKAVLSKSTAKRYFGNKKAINKTIRINEDNFRISAVAEDMPLHSHFHYDIIISMDEFRARGIPCDEGGPSAYYSYVKFKNDILKGTFEQKVQRNAWQTFGYGLADDETDIPEGYELKTVINPITNIHLNGHAEKEIEANSNATYIYIFTIVALFVLLIACINYMNLTTAKSFKRAKEVGVRKVLGAQRNQIFVQFMSESFFISLLSILIALLLVWIILPEFNSLTGKEMHLDVFNNLPLCVSLVLIYAGVGFLSGSYPSVFLSRFNPLKVLKSNTINDKSNKPALLLRRGLVILQFAISVILIAGAVTIYRQLVFIQNKKLGFAKENVVVVKTSGVQNKDKLGGLRDRLSNHAGIHSASSTSIIPGERAPFLSVRIPDRVAEEGPGSNEGDDALNIRVMSADMDMLKTFGFDMADGRSFSREFGTDADEAFILNEAAVKEFELENPVSSRFEYIYGLPEPKKGKVVGVVKDFHYASLHSTVEPLMIHIMPPFYRYIAIRIEGENKTQVLTNIEQEWRATFHELPFEYFFLDNFYENLYKSEMSLKTVITFFTFLAIFIACLGLLGLAAYVTQLRTKEMGIRKVLGASFGAIVFALSKEFMILILIANLLAWIPAWIFLENWLDSFAFRIQLGAAIFLITALLSFVIAVVTVGTQAAKAALVNPSQALKYE